MSIRTFVTILSIRQGDMKDPRNVPVISGDGGIYYYLPGCDHAATLKALKDIGFVEIERIVDVVSANPKPNNS